MVDGMGFGQGGVASVGLAEMTALKQQPLTVIKELLQTRLGEALELDQVGLCPSPLLFNLAVRRQKLVISNSLEPRVSLMAEIPEELHEALQSYLANHATWSQHRVFCAALSLFLMQNGTCDRDVNRIYLDALFDYVH